MKKLLTGLFSILGVIGIIVLGIVFYSITVEKSAVQIVDQQPDSPSGTEAAFSYFFEGEIRIPAAAQGFISSGRGKVLISFEKYASSTSITRLGEFELLKPKFPQKFKFDLRTLPQFIDLQEGDRLIINTAWSADERATSSMEVGSTPKWVSYHKGRNITAFIYLNLNLNLPVLASGESCPASFHGAVRVAPFVKNLPSHGLYLQGWIFDRSNGRWVPVGSQELNLKSGSMDFEFSKIPPNLANQPLSVFLIDCSQKSFLSTCPPGVDTEFRPQDNMQILIPAGFTLNTCKVDNKNRRLYYIIGTNINNGSEENTFYNGAFSAGK